MAVGDVVLLVDQSPRNAWALGRVVSIVTDKKGYTREAVVTTGSNVLRRPVHKLCMVLECDD